MLSLFKSSAVLVLLAAYVYFSCSSLPSANLHHSQHVLGLPELLAQRSATCGPTYITTAYVETITVESVVSVPHSCYSYTVETARHGSCSSHSFKVWCYFAD